jgi:hypothetical protein
VQRKFADSCKASKELADKLIDEDKVKKLTQRKAHQEYLKLQIEQKRLQKLRLKHEEEQMEKTQLLGMGDDHSSIGGTGPRSKVRGDPISAVSPPWWVEERDAAGTLSSASSPAASFTVTSRPKSTSASVLGVPGSAPFLGAKKAVENSNQFFDSKNFAATQPRKKTSWYD